MAKYRIRATCLEVYYSDIDSNDYPEYFDEEGNPKAPYELAKDGLVTIINNPDYDLYDRTFNYGIQPVDADWQFTDFTKEEETNKLVPFPTGISDCTVCGMIHLDNIECDEINC